MNDFTKEELIDIYWKFEYYLDDLDGLVEESPLMKKIQSMIDNYCEHEFKQLSRNDQNKKQITCMRCGCIVWREA